jgi:hypothetical protein
MLCKDWTLLIITSRFTITAPHKKRCKNKIEIQVNTLDMFKILAGKKWLPTTNIYHCHENDHSLTIFSMQDHHESTKQPKIIGGGTVI